MTTPEDPPTLTTRNASHGGKCIAVKADSWLDSLALTACVFTSESCNPAVNHRLCRNQQTVPVAHDVHCNFARVEGPPEDQKLRRHLGDHRPSNVPSLGLLQDEWIGHLAHQTMGTTEQQLASNRDVAFVLPFPNDAVHQSRSHRHWSTLTAQAFRLPPHSSTALDSFPLFDLVPGASRWSASPGTESPSWAGTSAI